VYIEKVDVFTLQIFEGSGDTFSQTFHGVSGEIYVDALAVSGKCQFDILNSFPPENFQYFEISIE
jgi:hypothetical protein